MSPNLYITRDGELVEEGDPRATLQAWREGGSVDEQRLDAMRPGLAKEVKAAIAEQKKAAKADEADDADAEEKAAEPAEDKAIKSPPEDKSAPTRRRG